MHAFGSSRRPSAPTSNALAALAASSALASTSVPSSSTPMTIPGSSSSALRSNSNDTPLPHIRIVPFLESTRSLHFDVIDRDLPTGVTLQIGRFTEKVPQKDRITFKSKVVSRGHAEIWTDNGKFYIKDTKSSSGTFLNHNRLSPPGQESRPFPLKDGDVVQLGVDYQGGTEEIYRCVKMRLEINRSWQQQANQFSLATFQSLRTIISPPNLNTPCSPSGETGPQGLLCTDDPSDCCICLYAIAPLQALFVAPCSHSFHYKCIRPLLQNHPGFLCPLCRTYADLEASVAIEAEEVKARWGIGSMSLSSPSSEAPLATVTDSNQSALPTPGETVGSPNRPPLMSRESSGVLVSASDVQNIGDTTVIMQDLPPVSEESYLSQTLPVAIASSSNSSYQLIPEEILTLNTPITSEIMFPSGANSGHSRTHSRNKSITNSTTSTAAIAAVVAAVSQLQLQNGTSSQTTHDTSHNQQNSDDDLYIVDPSCDINLISQGNGMAAQRNHRASVVEKLRMAINWEGKKARTPGKTPILPRRLSTSDSHGDSPRAGPSTPSPTRGRRSTQDGYPFPISPSLPSLPISNNNNNNDYSELSACPVLVASPSSGGSFLTNMDDESSTSSNEEARDTFDITNKRTNSKGKERAVDWGLDRQVLAMEEEESDAGEGRVM